MSLAALAEFKAYAKLQGTTDDAELGRILDAASALFLSATGLTLADLTTVTTVNGDGTTSTVEVSPPADVVQAILDQAAYWHAGRTRAGVQSEATPVGGSISYATRDLSVTFRAVVDAYRKWSV